MTTKKASSDKMICGKGVSFSTDSEKTQVNNNVIVVGGSGSGKTLSHVEPRILETFHSNLVVTVTKRRIVEKYTEMLTKRGYNVLDLNFISPEKSNISYDPLHYVHTFNDIKHLAESVVMADPRKKNTTADPFWDKAAISLVSACISYVLLTKTNGSFVDVLEMIDTLDIKENPGGGIITAYDKAFERIQKKNASSFTSTCWNSVRNLPIKTASCVYSSLNVTLDTVFSPDLRQMIAKERKLNFQKFAAEKTVLFVSTSAVNPAMHSVVNLFYSQLFKSLFEFAQTKPDGRLPIPVSILCDDFAVGSKINGFNEYISVIRETAISVTLLLQSESQLEMMYGSSESINIINNCDTYIFLGCNDLTSARQVSQRLNCPLENILFLPIGQSVIFRRGQMPIRAERFDTLNDKRYLEVTRQYENKISRQERE